jgi:hypothetical protein
MIAGEEVTTSETCQAVQRCAVPVYGCLEARRETREREAQWERSMPRAL